MATSTLAPQSQMTAEEFLDWAERNPGFYEFHAGEILAMAGPSLEHQEIASAALAAIRSHLGRGTPCRALMSGTAVRVDAADRILFPDVVVTCDPRDRHARSGLRHPSLIIEVLSPSTRDYDQGDKFRYYKNLESLKEYVLIDTEEQTVTLYRRGTGRHWGSDDFGPDESFEMKSIGLALNVGDIYADSGVPLPRLRPRLVESEAG